MSKTKTPKNGTTKTKKSVPSAKKNTKKSKKDDLLDLLEKVQSSTHSAPPADDTEKAPTTYLDEFTKVRRMALTLYCSPDRWAGALLNAKHYAYIYHDKDVNDDGTPKAPHYHLLLVFDNARYREAVRKLFDLEGLTKDTTITFQKLLDAGVMFQYLIHNTKKSAHKHRYPTEDRKCDDVNFWEDITDKHTADNEDFLNDLSTLSPRDMAIRYGRDYIRNYKRYEEFNDLLNAVAKKQKLKEELALCEAIITSSDVADDITRRAIAQLLARIVFKTGGEHTMREVEGYLYPTQPTRDLLRDFLDDIAERTYKALKEVYRREN